ncbi:hypothetical protein KPH14_006021 [Odynerus spinipes]|uniref:Uncharacterized protein n=1 Tax=Odynerus spinipes TaxID=1348599 RepID=A0AAD9RKR2_9HYME|nr:hypothetical protein KPH14_006021 [Odynerus spinipes]
MARHRKKTGVRVRAHSRIIHNSWRTLWGCERGDDDDDDDDGEENLKSERTQSNGRKRRRRYGIRGGDRSRSREKHADRQRKQRSECMYVRAWDSFVSL